ncbi:MAG: helix-turn-helix transcriptional regulator [Actinomycetia bacterium]|nr:helix-turn-helix transcriptional regulator [Actinomycetes bacterium]
MVTEGPGDRLVATILAALEEGPAHGYLIARRIRQWSEGAWALREGSLYPVLHDLEAAGLLTAVEERQGERSRRVYSLTPQGRTRLAEERERWRRQVRVLERVLWRERTGG